MKKHWPEAARKMEEMAAFLRKHGAGEAHFFVPSASRSSDEGNVDGGGGSGGGSGSAAADRRAPRPARAASWACLHYPPKLANEEFDEAWYFLLRDGAPRDATMRLLANAARRRGAPSPPCLGDIFDAVTDLHESPCVVSDNWDFKADFFNKLSQTDQVAWRSLKIELCVFSHFPRWPQRALVSLVVSLSTRRAVWRAFSIAGTQP